MDGCPFKQIAYSHKGGNVAYPFFNFLFGKHHLSRRKGKLVINGGTKQLRISVLKNISHLSVKGLCNAFVFHSLFVDNCAVKAVCAYLGKLKTVNYVQQGGFATAVVALDNNKRTVVNLGVKVPDNRYIVIGKANIVKLYHIITSR